MPLHLASVELSLSRTRRHVQILFSWSPGRRVPRILRSLNTQAYSDDTTLPRCRSRRPQSSSQAPWATLTTKSSEGSSVGVTVCSSWHGPGAPSMATTPSMTLSLLKFQRTKLKFKEQLAAETMQDPAFSYIVKRPMTSFNGLVGQVDIVKNNQPFCMPTRSSARRTSPP